MLETISRYLPRSVRGAALSVGTVRLASRAANAAARRRAAAAGNAYARAWQQRAIMDDTAESRSIDERGAANPLSEFFDARSVGRGIVKWRHYFEIYDRHLARFVGRSPRLLEIGIYAGGSLDMWRDYLGPRAELYGVDIDPYCRRFEEAMIFIGDQADRAFWQRFRAETPLLDIVIDDGGHTVEQQMVTLEELLPRLRPGGVYICEDIHRDDNAFLGYVSGLTRGLFAYDLTLDEENPERVLSSPATPFQSGVHSVHVYPYVVVIEGRDVRLDEFSAAQHGTEWPTAG